MTLLLQQLLRGERDNWSSNNRGRSEIAGARTTYYGGARRQIFHKRPVQVADLRARVPFTRFYAVNYKLELTREWYAAERVWKLSKKRRVIDAADRVKCGTRKSAAAHTGARWDQKSPSPVKDKQIKKKRGKREKHVTRAAFAPYPVRTQVQYSA